MKTTGDDHDLARQEDETERLRETKELRRIQSNCSRVRGALVHALDRARHSNGLSEQERQALQAEIEGLRKELLEWQQ
jgi:hypothetical protein